MRHPDWLARLRQAVREYPRAFAYGKSDCCLFVAHCVDAMTGSSLERELATVYGDRRGAARLLKTEGGFVSAVSRFLGQPIEGRAARRGDACQVGPRAVGICEGVVVRVSTGATKPLSAVIRHWRVD